jgi:Ca-activated chloride channel family protein
MKSLSRRHILTWICAALLSFAGLAGGQDEPTTRHVTVSGAKVQINQIETSQFPKVVIFATVLKDGVPLPGLTEQDFRVREDEVDQEPLTVEPKLIPLSVALTLDTSGSMKKRLTDAKEAAKGFLTMLGSQDKVQVIRFSRDVKTIYPLGTDRSAAEAAIDRTVARGDTALWDALDASVESLREATGRKAIVLLSDGVDDDGTGKPLSKHTVGDVLAVAGQVNVPIYAIGLGTELDERALKKVADETGALYLNAVEATDLARLYDNIGTQLAGQYTISYTSNLPADGEEHRVQMKVGESTSTKSYLPATTVADKQVTDQRTAIGLAGEVPTTELFLVPGRAKLSARFGPETPIIKKGVPGMWKIFEGQADFEGRRKRIATHHDAQPVVTLNEGDYKVQVKVGDAGRTVTLHAQAGSPAQGVIVLGAGQVKLSARLGPETPPLKKGVPGMWKIFEGQADFEGRRKRIATHHDAQPVVTLNEGDYKVQVKVGDATKMFDLSVKTGEQKPVEVEVGAGQVKLVARLGSETPPLKKGVPGMWKIFEGQADFEGRRKRIATHHDAQPVVTLNEGDYKVQVTVGDATQMFDLGVKAGEQRVMEVDVTAKPSPGDQ